jgi:hypothetical protein
MKSQSEQRRQEAERILEGIEKSGRVYWLAVLVKSGALLASEAGYMLLNWEGLK